MEIGERIYNLERIILNREGVTRADDDLPQRIKSEGIAVDDTGARHFLTDENFQSMLEEYYRERGWSLDGVPTQNKLKSLGVP